jgi:predicted nucleotide-binding protein (sugar kinase/HSP70/actin superfamily)
MVQLMANKSNKRRVTFPQMGNLAIPVAGMLRQMGAEVVLPPYNNKETLTYGTRHSVETVCLPYKIILGNFIQSLEAGANTIIMFQAPGTCRLGNYAGNIEAKLRELGYEFDMVIFDLYKGKLKEVTTKFAEATGGCNLLDIMRGTRLGFAKFDALDIVERKLFYVRPREITRGDAEKVYRKARRLIDRAKSVSLLKEAVDKSLKEMDQVPMDHSRDILQVHLTGEFYVLLDPFTNMEIEKELGYLGCEVDRQVMLSDWTNNALLPKFMYRKLSHRDRSVLYAADYMNRAIGGDCIESIGDAVFASRKRINGVVHIGPFNCTPEIVSQSILPHVSKNENIPVLSLVMDEHTGKAGLITRLEAFVDLIRRRHNKFSSTPPTDNKELALCT